MKKFLLFLLIVFSAYLTAFYTAGKKNGYKDPFDFSYLEQRLNKLSDFEPAGNEETLTSNHVQNGIMMLENKQYTDALDEFFLALNDDDNAENNYWVGHAYLKTEDYMSANAYLSTAIEMDPEIAEAYRDRGITKYYQNYYGEAIEDLYFATELKSDDAEAYYYLALSYEAQSQLEVALQSAETALKYESENIDYWFKAGYLAFSVEQYELSTKYYRALLERDSTYRYALINLGLCYARMNMPDSAHYWYDKTLQQYPDYALAYNNKGYVCQSQKEYGRAVELYTKAIIHDAYDTRPVWNRGDCYVALKEYDKAIKDFEKVYELNSDYYNVLFQIAECYEKKGDISSALRYYMQYKTHASNESAYYEEVDKRIKDLE